MILYNGCLYIHIPKTGGTSLRTAMIQTRKACMLTRIKSLDVDVVDPPNVFNPHAFLREALPVLGLHLFTEVWKFTIVRNPWDRFVSLYYYKKEKTPFPDFLDLMISKGHTQSKYLKDSFNYVGTIETIDEDWRRIAGRLGMKVEKVPRLNRSERKDRHYSDMYTSAMVQKVRVAERRLLERIPYRFER